jgi:tetratricopeptide (TPR) repeat protein
MSNDMRKILDQFKEKSQLVESTDPKEDPVEYNTSVVSKPGASANEMKLGDQFFNQGKYFDAYKQYKEAQKKEPNFFWAYYNAAASAYNSRSRKALPLIPPELQKAEEILKNWQGSVKEKSAATIRYQTLLRGIRATTRLNV